MNTVEISDQEVELLESIHRHSNREKAPVNQRDLAKILGISLGMTNAILKRLAEKGWLTIRKINNRNVQYAVSPTGIDQITRRSYRFLKRTVKNVVEYKETIVSFVLHVKRMGFTDIILVGKSDIGFILEHVCGKEKIRYSVGSRLPEASEPGSYYVFSEEPRPDRESSGPAGMQNVAYMSDILMGR